MSNIQFAEYNDDTSDEEYVPGEEDRAQLSEVETDGEPEDDVNSDNESNGNKHKKRKGKTKRKSIKKQKIEEPIEEEPEENKKLTEEEEKKKTDSLWADFLKDTNFKSKSKTPIIIENQETTSSKKIENKKVEKEEKVEKKTPKEPIIWEFAGEKIDSEGNVIEKKEIKPQAPTISRKSGGLGSVLSQIGKKQKITTLEKSRLDWDKYKRDENISDELKAHNQGKNGYLDKQDFLRRADQRQFEIEKEARAIRRTHRS